MMCLGIKATIVRDRIISRTPALASLRRTTGKASRVVTARVPPLSSALGHLLEWMPRRRSRRTFWDHIIILDCRSTTSRGDRLGCRNGSTIDDVIAAVNRGRAIGRKECYKLCDLLRHAWPANGNPADHVHDRLARGIFI